jgi:uncharacterized membrane protein
MDLSGAFLYQLGGYTVKLAHIFGTVIWLGGVLFMAGVATPILNYYNRSDVADPSVARTLNLLEERLIGFNWMGLWTVFISGWVISFYSRFYPSGFDWFRFESLIDWAIHIKILLFLPIAVVNYLLSVSHRELKKARAELISGEDISPLGVVEWRIVLLRRTNVYLAFMIILILALL